MDMNPQPSVGKAGVEGGTWSWGDKIVNGGRGGFERGIDGWTVFQTRKAQACSDVRGPVYEKDQVLSRTDEKSSVAGVDQRSIPVREVRAELRAPLPVTHRGTPSPKRIPSGRGGRDRFTAESYTVLGKEGGSLEGSGEFWPGL